MPTLRALVCFVAFSLAAGAIRADILITEVIPNVTTTATRGDVVELFNTGPGAVDLTDWVLTDLDDDPIAGALQDSTFAPLGLGVAPLQAGEFAVIDFVDAAGTASWQATNYGVRIVAPLQVGSFLGSENDELLLADASHAPIDFVAWADGGYGRRLRLWTDGGRRRVDRRRDSRRRCRLLRVGGRLHGLRRSLDMGRRRDPPSQCERRVRRGEPGRRGAMGSGRPTQGYARQRKR